MDPTAPLEITVHDLEQLRHSDEMVTILDIREPEEIAICAFEDSTNIPMNDIPGNLHALPDEGRVVVICHLGMRSAQVVGWLRQNGAENTVSLAGGIDAWSREIDSGMKAY